MRRALGTLSSQLVAYCTFVQVTRCTRNGATVEGGASCYSAWARVLAYSVARTDSLRDVTSELPNRPFSAEPIDESLTA